MADNRKEKKAIRNAIRLGTSLSGFNQRLVRKIQGKQATKADSSVSRLRDLQAQRAITEAFAVKKKPPFVALGPAVTGPKKIKAVVSLPIRLPPAIVAQIQPVEVPPETIDVREIEMLEDKRDESLTVTDFGPDNITVPQDFDSDFDGPDVTRFENKAFSFAGDTLPPTAQSISVAQDPDKTKTVINRLLLVGILLLFVLGATGKF